MKIERPSYMQQLIESKDNGLIKIVTGLRRVGKSYLLKTLLSGLAPLLSAVGLQVA
jgi:predicted AAA+ superfamily ATPase